MSAELPVAGEAGAIEAAAMAREYIWARLEAVRRLAVIGQDFAALADDRGLRYALMQIVAEIENASASFKENLPAERRAA